MSQLNWTEAQWNKVNSAITEEFTKGSVAGACLPCYGPVGASLETVSVQRFNYAQGTARINIIDDQTVNFWTIRTYVELNSEQVADENLASALFAFKRAANLLARTEDYLVFVGHDTSTSAAPAALAGATNPNAIPPNFSSVVANKDKSAPGLLTDPGAAKNHLRVPADPPKLVPDGVKKPDPHYGESLVEQITEAISKLEQNGYPGPYACVLGQNAFREAHKPSEGSLVLPADRITPMLAGPLLRSGSMPDDYGVVASACGESLDLVVATPPKAQFLQVNEDAKYVFRVYERFVLRIKDPGAVVLIQLV